MKTLVVTVTVRGPHLLTPGGLRSYIFTWSYPKLETYPNSTDNLASTVSFWLQTCVHDLGASGIWFRPNKNAHIVLIFVSKRNCNTCKLQAPNLVDLKSPYKIWVQKPFPIIQDILFGESKVHEAHPPRRVSTCPQGRRFQQNKRLIILELD